MEKTLHIGGRDVRFKATAATLIRYKAETGSEFLRDCAMMSQAVGTDADGNAVLRNAAMLNVDIAFGLAWAMAKTADKSIPDMLTWLDTFDDFDIQLVMSELFSMINAFLKVDAKNG